MTFVRRSLTAIAVLTLAAPTVFGVPASPSGLTHTVVGSTVTLTWTAPPGPVLGYRLEAGTAPGQSDAANILIGSTPSFVTTGVPPGTYHVRVRAVGTEGESTASNEAVINVAPAGGCATTPNTPGILTATVVGVQIDFSWGPSTGCAPTAYILHAGDSPGASNIATINVGNVLQFSATAPTGTYYVFVVAANGAGQSARSNIARVVVGSAPTTPTPTNSFGAGQWLVGAQVAPGRYFGDPTIGCYWERQRGLTGGLDDVISNEFVGFDALQWIVDIPASDVAFETDSECGTWFTSPRHGHQGAAIRPGVWLVGAQVTPGTYLASANSGCYWERLHGFSGNLADIADNEFVASSGQQLVTIMASDAGFLTDGDCGTWTRIADERLTTTDRRPKSRKDVELTWRAKYQHRTGAEPRALIRR